MIGEFLWNSDQRKWVKMAKKCYFWPLIRSSQKLSSHSKILILIFTTPKNFGQIPSAKKNFIPKNAIFGHFYSLSLVQISPKLNRHSEISIFTTPCNFDTAYHTEMAKKKLFLAIFCNFFCTNFPKISRGGKYCHFWITREFLWNLAQSGWKWPKIAFFGIESCAKSRRFKFWPDDLTALFRGSIGVSLQKSSYSIFLGFFF